MRRIKEGTNQLPYDLRTDLAVENATGKTDYFSGHGNDDYDGDIMDEGQEYEVTKYFSHSDGSIAFEVTVFSDDGSWFYSTWLAYDSTALAQKDNWNI